MATPPDVISGEVIEVEWGNDIRDFACFGFEMGGGSDTTQDGSLSTTYENGATVTFTKPATWLGYAIMAWGVVHFEGTAATVCNARVDIASNQGTPVPVQWSSTSGPGSASARHSRTGLSANATVNIQYNEASGTATKRSSTVNFIAYRTS